jgi:Holliday junction DNA helicase RuvA
MFEYIKGAVYTLKPSHIILEANSVGYFITISLNTYTQLNGKETAKLFIHQVIREDAHLDYANRRVDDLTEEVEALKSDIKELENNLVD